MNRTGVAVAALLTLLVLAGCTSARADPPNLDRARIGLDSVDGRCGHGCSSWSEDDVGRKI